MIYLPSRGAGDWQRLLAEPEKHWKRGRSARATAHCWESASGFPPEIRRVLTSIPVFASVEPLLAIPEHQVPLAGGRRSSQNDVWVLARVEDGLVSIAVEAKAGEPFGPTLAEWDPASSSGKTVRLQSLMKILVLEAEPPGDLRYQLLHRTGSAMIEANRFHASRAVMLVHSFGSTGGSFADFRRFVGMLGSEARPGELVAVGPRNGVELFLGWAIGEERFLSI